MNEGLGKVLFIAYDLDRFAEFLNDGRLLIFHEVDDEMASVVRKDMKEPLKLSFRYIRAQMDELYQIV
ncbi:MAG: hypothetical protein ABSC04_19825 [Syntrophobacteraceae bacterium]|jgi:hypothetical protein